MSQTHKYLTATISALAVWGIAGTAHAIGFSTTDGNLTAGGNSTFTFNVSGITPAQTQNVTLKLDITNNNTDSFLGLEGILQAPTGQTLTILQRPFASGTINGTLSDLGAPPIDLIVGASTFSGTYAPSGQLTISGALPPNNITAFSGFAGFNPNGTWNLIFNNTDATSGTLTGLTTVLDITPVPFEFSPATGILAVGALFGLDRLRRQILAKKTK